MRKFIDWLEELLLNLFPRPAYDIDPQTLPMNQDPEPIKIDPIVAPDPDALAPWDTPEHCRHNVRAIADLEGLTVAQKNLLSQVIHCESGYHPLAIHPNLYKGHVASTDRGICQWNDKYHSSEISNYEAFNDPEKCVRLMCQYVKRGEIKYWVCYSSGLYLQYDA